MFRKNLMKVIAVSLTSALIVVYTQGFNYDPESGQAEIVTRNIDVYTQNDGNAPKKIDNKLFKQEDVFIISNADGSIKDVVVSDWLQNGKEIGSIKDISELSDIKNVKGDEKFEANDGKLTWNADGKDIYYQGSIKKELPVDIAISYKLDGKDIKADELAGKSGKVEIKFDYTNNVKKYVKIDGKEEEMYSPFLMFTGLVMDNAFTNIDISNNGKVISLGDKSIVVGYALPGMQTNLGISEDVFKIPTSFTIKADVKDFKLSTAMSIALNDEFTKLDDVTSKMDKNDIEGTLNKLSDSTNKLVNGSTQLYEGITELKSKAGTMVSGIKQLSDGATTLNTSLGDLKKGDGQVHDGVTKLSDGAQGMSGGIKQIKDGTNKINPKLKKASSSSKELSSHVKEAAKKADELNSAVSQSVGSFSSIPDVSELKSSAAKLDAGVDKVATNLEATIEGNKQIIQGLRATASGVTDETSKASLNALIDKLQNTVNGQSALLASLKAGGGDTLKDGTSKLKTSADNFPNAEKIDKIKGSVSQLSQGTSEFAKKLKELSAGAGKLSDGIGQISSGVNQVDNGVNELYGKSIELKNGAKDAKDGSAKVYAGIGALAGGANKLDTNLLKLKQGTSLLTSGVDKLASGSKELSGGLKMFKEQGIGKIMDFYNNNLTGLSDRLVAIKDLASEYSSFAGKSDDMDGVVKFIYRTEAIDKKMDAKKED